MKPVLPFLETMATQVCNISCLGCTNYSDITQSGYVTWADLKSQLTPWLDIIDIPDFGIMGGEPLINPQIKDILLGVRKLMPTSQIRFTTNGLLLHKHRDIIDLMEEIGNCVFKITVHLKDETLEDIIKEIHTKFKWDPVYEFGINRFKTKNNFKFQVNRPSTFIKTYRNSYNDMMPYNSVPTESFDSCIQQTCPLLHQGIIYKCSTQGLLKETLSKFGNPNIEDWAPYLNGGISTNSKLETITEFISNFGKPHQQCAMCPSPQDAKIAFITHIGKRNGR